MPQLEGRGRVGGGGQHVVHERGGESLAALVVGQLHVEGVGQPLHHRAVDLPLDDPGLQHVPAVVGHDPPVDAHRAGLGVDLEHHRVAAVGEARLRHREHLRVLEPGR